jgi:predicted nucleotidyltransferase
MEMKPSSTLLEKADAVKALAGRFPVKNPRLFGSTLSQTDHERSDIDLLVDALPGATLFDLGGLQVELEDLLGCRVDLVTPEDLPVAFRARILAQAKPL